MMYGTSTTPRVARGGCGMAMMLCIAAAAAPTGPAASAELRLARVEIDAQPPKNPWVKAVGDLDGDGRTDVVLAPAEFQGGTYRIAWYEAPADAASGDWTEHVVEPAVETVVHGLAVADMDRDGRPDIVAARMHQGKSPQEVAIYLNRRDGRQWARHVVSTTGSHNIVAADLDGDGRPDILGANHGGPFQPVELWRNLAPDRGAR
jgi:hypothetical protein